MLVTPTPAFLGLRGSPRRSEWGCLACRGRVLPTQPRTMSVGEELQRSQETLVSWGDPKAWLPTQSLGRSTPANGQGPEATKRAPSALTPAPAGAQPAPGSRVPALTTCILVRRHPVFTAAWASGLNKDLHGSCVPKTS